MALTVNEISTKIKPNIDQLNKTCNNFDLILKELKFNTENQS